MIKVVSLDQYRKVKRVCFEVPASERCTARLHGEECPGMCGGTCVSPNLDPKIHNPQLPLFFAEQH